MKKMLSACICISFIYIASAQSIDSTIAKYGDGFQYEKTWLHYDKSTYFPGETVWFKVYLMEDLYPAQSSKTLYIDWIAPDGKVLNHTVSPIVEGTSNGQFVIPEDFKQSFVHVRAYTKWMLNFDTSFLYNRNIPILSKNPALKKQKPEAITTLQFFPEGGDAIAGIINRIAFKANDQYGIPVPIRAALVDQNGKFIDSIRSVHDGMGSFLMKPDPGIIYTARWKDAKGLVRSTDLPAAINSGIALQVNSEKDKKTIVLNTGISIPHDLTLVHVVGTMNQRLAFKTSIPLSASSSVKRVIPTGNLPSGLLTITVFDKNYNALSERICFVQNDEYRFETKLEVNHWGMGKRKRNEIEITVPENMAAASLSVAVTDAAISMDSSENIISHFLLTSEIRGRVHNPAYYFNAGGSEHLDLVMLTHGWRRFKWEDIVAGKLPEIKFERDTSYMHLSGKVMGVARSQLTGNDNIVLMVKEDSITSMLIMPINMDGTFDDPNIILFDTMRVYYSLKSKFFKTAEARFMLNRLASPNYSEFMKNLVPQVNIFDTTGNYRQSLLAAETLRLQELLKGKILENVTVRANQKTSVQELEDKYTSGLFKGDAHQFDLVNDAQSFAYQTALQYLQGKVAGLQISDNPPSLSWRGGTPAVYLDEIPTDIDLITTIPVTDIAYIKVFRPPFMGGFNGSNGAIAIYTRRGNDMKSTSQGLSNNSIAGYTPIREFYSPNYDRFEPGNEQPDMRTTLYWNPQVTTTPGNNKIRLTFYNNDVSSAFRVRIEGMSKDGLMTYFSWLME